MKSIALKLWLGMMALLSIVLLVLWLSQIVFLEKFYTGMRVADVKSKGLEAVEVVEQGNQYKSILDELAYNNNLTAELLDSRGKTIYTTGSGTASGQMPMMMMNSLRTEAFNAAQKGEETQVSMTHPRFGGQYMLIGLPAETTVGGKAVLIINFPLAPVRETAAILKRQLFYISLILLGASLILSYLLSKSFTRPILDITNVSLEMAGGNLSARTKIIRRDEIGRLAESINYLGQELGKVDQLRKDLIANISHELRTPLSIIKGYGETIRDISGSMPEKREKQIAIIIEEADRLSKMVDDILDFSQIQAGYSALNLSRFKIDETLDRVVKRYEVFSTAAGIGIQLKSTPDLIVAADEIRIEQVLYNLINNAFKHSSAGDMITVTAVETKERVRVEVADTGEGIPEEEIPYIWDRFYKGDRSGDRKMSGTGLGLAIVKSILNAHQTPFGVESQVNTGSTFWFELKK